MERHQMSDEQLLQLFVEGNKWAMEVLFERHKNRVYSYIFLMVKNKKVAEDFFQDAFVKAVRSIQSGAYKEDGKFLPWLMRIAHNLVIDYFRKQKNYRELSHDRGEYDLFNNANLCESNVEDELIKKQSALNIRDLIKRLPEEQRQLVVMRVYLDMSFKEIAESTGVSINTALGRMRYAVINLRKLIDEQKVSSKSKVCFS